MNNKLKLFEVSFLDELNNKLLINHATEYNYYLFQKNNLNEYNNLLCNAKRGDLIINKFIKRNRNYNIGIIDIINSELIIKPLD